MSKYKITFNTINPLKVNQWLNDKDDSKYEWNEVIREADSFNEINQQLVQLITWQSNREQPIKDVKLFKSEINWIEVKQENIIKV